MGSYNSPMNIFVSTDNHLGYAEKDPERGDDSFNTFEEILELAVEKNADMVLLGGDLFHENNPSRNAVLKCMQIMRKYSIGDKAVQFQFVSDATVNFPHLKSAQVNYMDKNLNISLPIFSIHGNHDDPSGHGHICPLEILSTAGLVNYFGRCYDLKQVEVSPILLEKGKIQLAIYGMSHIKDERLFRLFRENKVKFKRPKEDPDNWFNILVLHQNHAKHSPTSYIPETFIDDFIDLVIWGHEHECLLEPRMSGDSGFFVTQPGSSVATSLCAGEAVKKYVGLLEVKEGGVMRMNSVELKTVRPFVFEDVCLDDYDIGIPSKNDKGNPIEEFIEEHVLKMIDKAKEQLTGHKNQPTKPLIRLRVEYSNEAQMFNICRFAQKFENTIANSDIIMFKKLRKINVKDDIKVDKDAMDAVFEQDVSESKVEDVVEQYFSELDGTQQMNILSEKGMAHAVGQFVQKEDKDAISDIFNHRMNKITEHLLKMEGFTEENINEHIADYRHMRVQMSNDEEEMEAVAALADPKRGKTKRTIAESDDSDSDISIVEAEPVPTRGRGSRARAPRAARGSRGAANKTSLEFSNAAPIARGRGRDRGRATATSNSSNARSRSMMESFSRAPASQKSQRGSYFESDSD